MILGGKVEDFDDLPPLSPGRIGPYQDTIREEWRSNFGSELGKPWMMAVVHWSCTLWPSYHPSEDASPMKLMTFYKLKKLDLSEQETFSDESFGY